MLTGRLQSEKQGRYSMLQREQLQLEVELKVCNQAKVFHQVNTKISVEFYFHNNNKFALKLNNLTIGR